MSDPVEDGDRAPWAVIITLVLLSIALLGAMGGCVVRLHPGLQAADRPSGTPLGWGFGDAAIRMAGQFRMYPKTIDGQPTDDGEVRVPINFEPER